MVKLKFVFNKKLDISVLTAKSELLYLFTYMSDIIKHVNVLNYRNITFKSQRDFIK